jgi:DNA primase
VLPEIREGREIRFLFLPEGEDPDTLVGREGREAFEARLATALPLSEYLIAHLREQVDLSHADGRARYAALARPLLEKLPAGVYRALLLERIGSEIGLSGERLGPLLQLPTENVPAPERARIAPIAGARRSLITHAIQMLLHYPACAQGVDASLRADLEQVDVPGMPVLRELLADLAAAPGQSLAQLLERWRERGEYKRLAELAAAEVLVTDSVAAGRELTETLGRLLEQVRRQRLDDLIAKARDRTIDASETLELQALTQALGRSR